MIKELERLDHEFRLQLEMSKETAKRSRDDQKLVRKFQTKKLREIEKEIKEQKMKRLDGLFQKLEKQTQFAKSLQIDESAVRAYLNKKLK